MSDRGAAGYDRLARHYAWIEKLRFGNTLQRARVSGIRQLTDLHSSPRVLILGDGDGRLLEAFLQQCPAAKVTSVDLSPKMLEQQRNRIAALNRHDVTWICSPIEMFAFPTSTFDIVITAFFLDCFDAPQLSKLLPRIAGALKPQSNWYVVDFCEPDRGLRRMWAKFWLAIMHTFFRWQTGLRTRRIVDPRPQLRDLGFEPQFQSTFHFEMIVAAIYQRRQPTRMGD
ncbi:class I SAM-dependent methyltransferase [Novipirellula caenicola]|uniref:2-methoxy-6-polyprenyl-1,4-benzoquinol methylase, mitochondrial n=1 Tax=Novipirellula caenicola TaxID=1536901 RepID=A0ABP9W016_9BACT